MHLHGLIRQDHRLFDKCKKGELTDKNASKAVISLIKRKRKLIKDLSTALQPYLNDEESEVQVYPLVHEPVQAPRLLPNVGHHGCSYQRLTGGNI